MAALWGVGIVSVAAVIAGLIALITHRRRRQA
jgi:hypothetical protein